MARESLRGDAIIVPTHTIINNNNIIYYIIIII